MYTLQRQINIPTIMKIGKNELDYLGKHLQNSSFKRIACFYSSGIEELFGENIDKSLAKYSVEVVHKDVIDDINIENVIHTAFSIPKNVDALIGIGGGKALDYSKYCAHVLALPYISVPTSTSNDGFCSPNASLLVDGKRKSVTATIPFGVVVDIDIIKSSPENCIFSGLGDLISKVTACWDWTEAAKCGNESINDFAYLMAENSVSGFLKYQNEDRRSDDFLYNLVNSLLMSGISMEIARSSRPASGSEHLISHSLDKISSSPRMHGIQVGISTYLCALLQNNQPELVKNFLINTGFMDHIYANPLNREEFIQAVSIAPFAKEEFFTVLSCPGKIEEAISIINTDELLLKALV